MPTVHQGNFEPLNQNFTRILEDGNTRVTQSSDTRITDTVLTNTIESTFYAKVTYIPFYSRVYIKINSVWKQVFPNAKHNAVWKVPQKVYSKINNIWKRIY